MAVFVAACIVCSSWAAQAARIDRAVIYDDQAVISFTQAIKGTLDIEAPACVVAGSLVVRPLDGARVESASLTPARVESGAARSLREELAVVQTALSLKKRELTSTDRQIDTIFQVLASKDANPGDTRRLLEVLGFVDERVRALNKKAVETQSAIAELETRAKDLKERLASLGDGPGWVIRITGSGRVNVSYAVLQATFKPEYRIHALPDSSSLSIDYLATISQATGMDWEVGELLVATGRPSHGIHAPEPVPWHVGSAKRVFGKASAEAQDISPLTAPAPAGALTPDTEPTTVTTVIGVAKDVRLPGDGTPVTAAVAGIRLDAAFTAIVVPRLDQRAYLRGETTLAGAIPVVEGPYAAFVDGVYAGSGMMGRFAPGQKMTVDFGVQEGILVRRTEEKAFHERTITGKDRTTYAYTIEVENRRGSAVHAVVMDQIPVSDDESVEVRLTAATPKAEPDHNGFLRWDTTVEPGRRRTFSFEFSVTGARLTP